MKIFQGKKAFGHFWLKVAAVLLAFLIWLIVMNVDDYKITRTIADITVEQLNGDVIDSLGMVYDVVDGEKADIVVKGPRSVVESLNASDFRAYADLSQLSITNTTNINVEAVDSSVGRAISITKLDDTMTLSIEEKASVELPINVITTGNVGDGYALGTCVSTPNLITVEGPQSVLGRINEIRAVVNLNNSRESFERTVSINVFDAYGESLDNKHIELSSDEVTVTVPVYPTKTVDVELLTRGEPSDGYSVRSISYNPQSVTIFGEKESLDAIDKITIRDITISGADDSIEENILLSNYIPQDIYLTDNNLQIAINIVIEKHIQKRLSCSEADIELKNRNPEFEYNLTVPNYLTITVSGLNDVIENIEIADIAPYVDFGEYEAAGEYEIPIEFNALEGIEISGNYTLKLVINSPEEENTEE